MANLLYRLGHFSFRRRGLVAAIWELLLAALAIGALSLGGRTTEAFSIPGTESQRALDDLRTDLPAAFKEDMKLFHLALPKSHPQIYEQVERGGGTGYRETRHEDFQLIVDLRRSEAQERRRR